MQRAELQHGGKSKRSDFRGKPEVNISVRFLDGEQQNPMLAKIGREIKRKALFCCKVLLGMERKVGESRLRAERCQATPDCLTNWNE